MENDTRPSVRERCEPPEWSGLAVQESEGSAWNEDRQRKFERIRVEAVALLATVRTLSKTAALARCSVETLRAEPSAVGYYLALAGFSSKTLKNSRQRWRKHGLKGTPESLGERLRLRPSKVRTADLMAFCAWVNEEIEGLIGDGLEDDALYAIHAAMIVGGRVIGQTQNEGGELAVEGLKRCILSVLPADTWQYEVESSWHAVLSSPDSALRASRWRHSGSSTIFEFIGGGNRPDVVATRAGQVVLAAEVKGRKDLSNTWESWMPQVADHMRTWRGEFPRALVGVFMTIVTQDMIVGQSRMGTRRVGLQDLHADGLLDFAFNLSKLAQSYSDASHGLFARTLEKAMQS